MDVFKMQQKYKLKKKELRDEALHQSEEFLDLINKPIPDPDEYERVMNLKDFQMRNLREAVILNDDNRTMLFGAIFKTIVEQYWKEKDLPTDEREIYKNSYTDDGLKKAQKGYLKLLQARTRTYKKEIADWWEQREHEDAYYCQNPNKKTNGKADDD